MRIGYARLNGRRHETSERSLFGLRDGSHEKDDVMKRWWRLGMFILLIVAGISSFAFIGDVPDAEAGGPLLVNDQGVPFVWRRSRIPYTPDRGRLGALTNGQAINLVAQALGIWENVTSSRVRFRQEGQLDLDVTERNVLAFLNHIIGQCQSGGECTSPIIFDTNGRITDALLGAGASRTVLGFAGPTVFRRDGVYLQARAVLNGRFPPSDLLGTAVHEFGHYIGLDHTQLNSAAAFDFTSRNDDEVPTMFPFIVEGTEVLHLDDEVAVSALYPDFREFRQRGTISGHILLPDGTGFQGANVIARRVDDPRMVAVSSVSGFLHVGTRSGPDFGSDDPELLGFYELPGLPPGRYTVEIEQIRFDFTGGSGVGPLDPPAELPGPPEFYSGEEESSTDDPDHRVEIEIMPGDRVEDVDIILNVHRSISIVRGGFRQGMRKGMSNPQFALSPHHSSSSLVKR